MQQYYLWFYYKISTCFEYLLYPSSAVPTVPVISSTYCTRHQQYLQYPSSAVPTVPVISSTYCTRHQQYLLYPSSAVPTVPVISSTILQLAVTGITYIKLDRKMYGNVHLKCCQVT